MEGIEKQTPVRQSLCGSLRRDGHWKCLCLTLLITGCLTAISWCHITLATQRSPMSYRQSWRDGGRQGPCKEGYIYIPVAFVVMLYLVYLVECWHSHARLELRYKCDIGTVYSTISALQAALPVIWWKATCYHYVRRTRQVMRYRNGDAFTSTQVYYERVDSSTAGAAFNFTRCGVKDISRPLVELEKHAAIKIKVSKGFSFANLDTELEFEEQRAQFFQEYETRDDYMEGREGMDMVNTEFKEYMIAFKDPNNLPWYVSHAMYWAASVLLLSWPLRVIIEYKTAHLHYHIHKLFGSNYLEGEHHAGEGGPLSRVSTMNSAELEMSIRNNNVIVPSYSEAVLFGGVTNAEDDMSLLLQRQRTGYGAIKKAVTGGKLSRSLTTATLAARSSIAGASSGDAPSSRRTSITPAVTMNRVKRFKSCGTFAKADSMEESSSTGTVRQQVQQLLRDRGRLQRHKGRSSYSVSGLSLSNGRARFSVGTPGTPDERVISPTLSIYSAASFRPSSAHADFDLTGSNDNSVVSEVTTAVAPRSRTHVRPHSVALDGSVNRIVPSDELGLRSHAIVAANSIGASIDTATGVDSFLRESSNSQRAPKLCSQSERRRHGSLPFSRENSATFERVVVKQGPSPVTPSSPPLYGDAIKMERIPTKSRHRGLDTLENRADDLASEHSGLNSRTARESSDSCQALAHACLAPKTDVVCEEVLPIDGIRSDFYVYSPITEASLTCQCSQPDAKPISSTSSQSNVKHHPHKPHRHQVETSYKQQIHHQQQLSQQQFNCDKQRHQDHQCHQQQKQYSNVPAPPAPLKALPKVSSTVCPDSDDSDSECLHGSWPEAAGVQNVPFQNASLSPAASQHRSSPFRSIARASPLQHGALIITAQSPPPPPPHLRIGSDPPPLCQQQQQQH